MFVKKYKPYTPSMRFKSVVDKRYLSNYSFKLLSFFNYRSIGKSKGRIICRFRHKQIKKSMNFIDFFRNTHLNIPFQVLLMKYDSYRTSFVALCSSFNGIYTNFLSSENLFIGSFLYNWNKFFGFLSEGDSLSLIEMPFGSVFFHVEKNYSKGAQIARSAGTSCYFINKFDDLNKALVELPSGKRVYVSLSVRATVGICSNSKHKHICYGNAGKSFFLGKKPHTRGVAMNPVDHPHGGGEGKKSGRSCPYSPWRKHRLFKKTHG